MKLYAIGIWWDANLTFSLSQITIPLQREGSDEHAAVFWSLTPVGPSQQYVSLSDIGPFEGSVTFASGQGTSAINLTIWPDDMPEMDEIVRLTLNRSVVLYVQ